MSSPPEGLPRYRLLTGKDDAAFCHRVSDALTLGFRLHGSPALTFNGEHLVVAQALIWDPTSRQAAQLQGRGRGVDADDDPAGGAT
jgi:hypothetical protein